MKFRSRAVAAACVIALLPIGAVPSVAEPLSTDPPVHLGEGQAVGDRLVQDPAVKIEQATSSYFITSYGDPNDHSPEPWQILSTADGSVVRTSPRLRDNPTKAPTLLGKYILDLAPRMATFLDIGTGVLSQVGVPADATFQGAYPGGILLSRAAGGGSFALLSLDNTEKAVTGAAFGDAKILDSTDAVILLGVTGHLYVVDLTTGTATSVATLSANPDWAQLTPNRVIWQTAATATSRTVGWQQRSGSGSGTTTVPFGLPLLTVGDDVAVHIARKTGDPVGGTDLVKIAVNGGAITRPFVTDVHAAADLADGRLLVTAQSQVATVAAADKVLHIVKTTPSFAEQVRNVALSGNQVVASDNQVDPVAFPNHELYETSTSGSSWTQLTGGNWNEPFQLEGNTLLTREMASFDNSVSRTRVRGPNGDLVLPNALDEIVLGKGGKLVARRNGGATSFEIYDVGAKAKVADYDPPFALADSTIWKVSANGVLTGKDLISGSSKSILVGDGCTVGSGRVNGRWALLSGCVGGNQVIDVRGTEPPRYLTVPADAELGNGFVLQPYSGTDANGLSTKELLVTDLNDPALGQRRYGTILGRLIQPSSFRADGAGGAKFVYADPNARPRLVTLSWLAPDPQQRPDTTPPVLISASAGDRVIDNRTVSFAWAFSDPSSDPNEPPTGLWTYDLRIQQRAKPTDPYGAWREVAGWQGIKDTTASLTANPGTDTCWQVRGRDRNKNLSAWSSSYCSEVDGTPPSYVTGRPGDRVILTTPSKYTYSFTDNLGLVTHDVAYRTAAAGQALGAWVYPAGWQGIQSTSVDWAPTLGSDRCFMSRARDAIGNTSAWSPATCSVNPQDDRALTATGSVTRTTSPLAFQSSTSQLKASGASLSKSGEAGTRIALVTINGPGQGSVDVYHAGIKIGRVSLASPTWTRKVTYLPITPYRTGAVKITSVSALPSLIDGVAFLRA
jgi:hypothetical protein